MKFVDIVANALEICDAEIENACFYNNEADLDLYVKRRNKIRNWYLSRLIRGCAQ